MLFWLYLAKIARLSPKLIDINEFGVKISEEQVDPEVNVLIFGFEINSVFNWSKV